MQDGAEWLQGLVDYDCADAVRILDFAHAAEHINDIGEAVRAAGGRLPARWLEGMLHRLKHQGPTRVLTHLSWLATRYPSPLIEENLSYLQKREAHLQYPTFQKAGWPIGSGSVESANKLVVEARLKGAGMRGPRHNVNPMLVLRNAVCNRRWDETWQAGVKERQARRIKERQADSQLRLTDPPVETTPVPVAMSSPPPVRRLGAGYSWRQPFLRRPASSSARTGEASAKK